MPADKKMFGSHRSFAEQVRDTLMFAACYVALDWASYIYPLGPFNITPWNPPPALSIVWLMLGGLAYAPIILATIFIADVVIRNAPGGLLITALTSLILAGGYTAIAGALRYFLKSDCRLSDTRRLWIFVAVTAIGTAIVGVLYIGILWANGFFAGEELSAAVFRFWLGDAVGVLITAPLLLLAADAEARKRLADSWRRPETGVQFVVMAATMYFVFRGAGGEPSKYFYLLFLPLIWIALRGGFVGAALASGVVQIGVVLGVRGGPMHSLALVELQALVAALSLSGLFLGVMVDERARAAERLKASLRLAAAGEMAGAIAHEINQPLAALANYGRACQLYLERGEGKLPFAELNATIEKMLGESRRAAEVVGRLRDFFRTGTMRLESVTVQSLLEMAQRIASKLDPAGDVDFRVETDAGAVLLLADRLQLELILRNLIANAFEAIATQSGGEKSVTILADRAEGDGILFRVKDSGPGLSPSARELLFEPFSSTKPMGMGLGLAISQAIAEAHGGSLKAAPTKHGEFHLLLPGESPDE